MILHNGRDWRKREVLYLLVAFLILIKLPISLSLFPVYRSSEELAYGGIGKALLDGFGLSIINYRLTPCANGNLIVGLLAAPFFMLFGSSLFSLKLLSLSFLAGILITIYLFLNKYFGRRTAIISCLLYILAPQSFTQRSLILYGNHFESILFTMLIIFIFYEIFFNHRGSRRNFNLFGLVSGFAVCFCYNAFIPLIVCFILWFSFDRRFFLKASFLRYILFFVIGLSPLIAYNFKHEFQGVLLHGETIHLHFFKKNLFQTVQNLRDIVIYDLFNFFQIDNINERVSMVASSFYCLLFLSAICFIFWLNKDSMAKVLIPSAFSKKGDIAKINISRETFFIIYPALFLLVYALSDLRGWISFDDRPYLVFRYLVPLFPFVAIIISFGLNKLWTLKRKFFIIISRSALAALIAIGLLSNIKLLSWKDMGKVINQNGYSYSELGWLIGINNFYNDEKSTDLINKFYSKFRTLSCYEGIGWRIGVQSNVDGGFRNSLILIERRYRPYCYYGIGQAIGEKCSENIPERSVFTRLLENNEKKYWPELIGGIGSGLWLFDRGEIDSNKVNRWINNIPDAYKKYFYRGLMRSSFSSNSEYAIIKPVCFIGQIPAEYKGYAYEGLGWAISEIFGSDPVYSAGIIGRVDKKFKSDCYKGFIQNFKYLKGDGNTDI